MFSKKPKKFRWDTHLYASNPVSPVRLGMGYNFELRFFERKENF
jgi:hypothetical protein